MTVGLEAGETVVCGLEGTCVGAGERRTGARVGITVGMIVGESDGSGVGATAAMQAPGAIFTLVKMSSAFELHLVLT